MQSLELLAPARDLECGKTAIDHGADAVYIGADRFGARAAAGNSVADIAELCRYAHRFRAKVYVTVNTIVYDSELEATRRLIQELDSAGVDAVLVQDMAVLGMLKDHPDVAAHASTQTDNRTIDKVRWLRSAGFSRAVLARELSVGEIAAIHEAVPDMELEVFVHGALCVSYSGLCYASHYCFNRSANRGECAQFCRLRFNLIDANGAVVERDRHLLSLKDMNQSDNLGRLAEAGATSFKIEGRLKDASYVKNVTAAYSQRLGELVKRHPDKYCRASLGRCSYTFEPNLSKTFNRGYTTYFADGRQPDISSVDTPKAIGEYVGYVKEVRGGSFTVAGTAVFANGDGLCFMNGDRQLEGFRVNRVENNRLFPLRMPSELRRGLHLYRNNDMAFERSLAHDSAQRKIPVTASLDTIDEGFCLTLAIKDVCEVATTVEAEHQAAQKPQRDNIVRQLTKFGNTIYECDDVRLPDDFNFFIPSGVLAAMRREAVSLLEEQTVAGCRCQTFDKTDENEAVPDYGRVQYQYNVANKAAEEFYSRHGKPQVSPAFELRADTEGPLMQCRYCLRYALGRCIKHGGRKPEWREPLSLVLPDGRHFRLEFDCRNCQMNVYAD